MSEDLRCLIVDGHPVVRLGVRELLGDRYDVEEAAGWDDARDALTQTGEFDVAIIELEAPAGPDADGPAGTAMIRALRKASPGLAIVAHGRHAERHAASEALDAGAGAFVAKSSPAASLEQAVAAAGGSAPWIDPEASNGGSRPALTPRQREILQLLADGNSTVTAAHRLGLSAETVRTHSKAILSRLEARDRAHAVAIAMRSGLID